MKLLFLCYCRPCPPRPSLPGYQIQGQGEDGLSGMLSSLPWGTGVDFCLPACSPACYPSPSEKSFLRKLLKGSTR